MSERDEIAGMYFHINNGGIDVSVLQGVHTFEHDGEDIVYKAPALSVTAHHFGQQTNSMRFSLSPEALKALGEMLIAASDLAVVEGSPMMVENPRQMRRGHETVELGLPAEVQCSGSVQ